MGNGDALHLFRDPCGGKCGSPDGAFYGATTGGSQYSWMAQAVLYEAFDRDLLGTNENQGVICAMKFGSITKMRYNDKINTAAFWGGS